MEIGSKLDAEKISISGESNSSFFSLSSFYYRLDARFTGESFVSSLKRFEFERFAPNE